jgi:hypothetical protein
VYALLSLVEQAELSPLVGVYDGKDAGNAFADIMNAGELGVSAGDLASPELDQLPSKPSAIRSTFDAFPWATHDFSSCNCVFRSSLFLLHSWAVFYGGGK